MPARTHGDDRDGAIELELYLPAGIIPPVETRRLERLRTRLFDHGVDPSNR
ncbi:MAG: hypothetical protein SVG88_10590 [Halobacteriales archaeon]|nr:hypothetical protein [Halobacteriales archaeon]